MFKLNTLEGLVKKRKRIGRGGAKGGTSTKGHKGQRARSGGKKGPYFEGGQMPIQRRVPKRGFNNYKFREEFEIVDLARIQLKFDNGESINKISLVEKGLIKGGAKLKVLNSKDFSKKLNIEADAFSKSAMDSIVSAGGEAVLTKEG